MQAMKKADIAKGAPIITNAARNSDTSPFHARSTRLAP
jgi:hypothetical protein